MRNVFGLIVCCFILLSGSLFADTDLFNFDDVKDAYLNDKSIFETKFKNAVLKKLEKIDKLDLKIDFLDSISTLSGKFSRLRLKALGSSSKQFRIHRIEFDLTEPKINMRKLWEKEKIELVRTKELKFSLIINEKDINDYFKSDTKKRKIKNPYIRIKENGIELSGKANWWIFKTSFKLRGRFIVMNETEIHFKADKIKVSILPLPRSLLNGVMKKVNPIYDLSELPFPVKIGKIRTINKRIIIESSNDR